MVCADGKSEMRIRCSRDVEPVGIVEHLSVPVGARIADQPVCAGAEVFAVDDDVIVESDSGDRDRADEADELVDACRPPGRLVHECAKLVRILEQGRSAGGEQRCGCGVSGEHEEHAICQQVAAIDGGVVVRCEQRDQVVRGMRRTLDEEPIEEFDELGGGSVAATTRARSRWPAKAAPRTPNASSSHGWLGAPKHFVRSPADAIHPA